MYLKFIFNQIINTNVKQKPQILIRYVALVFKKR